MCRQYLSRINEWIRTERLARGRLLFPFLLSAPLLLVFYVHHVFTDFILIMNRGMIHQSRAKLSLALSELYSLGSSSCRVGWGWSHVGLVRTRKCKIMQWNLFYFWAEGGLYPEKVQDATEVSKHKRHNVLMYVFWEACTCAEIGRVLAAGSV